MAQLSPRLNYTPSLSPVGSILVLQAESRPHWYILVITAEKLRELLHRVNTVFPFGSGNK